MKLIIFVLCLTTVFASPLSKKLRTRNGFSSRIIGGESARIDQFPFASAIYITTPTGQYFCVGSILNRQWVLTSASCIDGGVEFRLQFGSNNLFTVDPGRTEVSTFSFEVHPAYDGDSYENNLGLLQLNFPIVYGENVQPIYLPGHPLDDNSLVTIVGWGQTSDSNDEFSNDLKYVAVTSLSNAVCGIFYQDAVTDNIVCVQGNYNEGFCHGDTGSPLVRYQPRSPTLHVGIATFISGSGCETTEPSGYTRTHPYVDWIRNLTNAQIES